jgi:hypothetical protein
VTEYFGSPLKTERKGAVANARAHIRSGTPHIPVYLEVGGVASEYSV